MDRGLHAKRQHSTAVSLAAIRVREIDIDLIDAAIFDHRREVRDLGLEFARVMAVLVEIHRQQDGVRAKLCCLHQPHGRVHTKLARRIGSGGDHPTPRIVAQPRKRRGVGRCADVVHSSPAAADDHRQAAKLRISQQFDRGIERVHVQMRDASDKARHRNARHGLSKPQRTLSALRLARSSGAHPVSQPLMAQDQSTGECHVTDY